MRNKNLKLYGSFLWMGFNCAKATATSRRQFIFYHSVPRNSWYSFYRSRKDERLSRHWSHPVVLNTGLLDWESSALTTSVFIVNFEYISRLVLVFLLLTLSRQMLAGNVLPLSHCYLTMLQNLPIHFQNYSYLIWLHFLHLQQIQHLKQRKRRNFVDCN